MRQQRPSKFIGSLCFSLAVASAFCASAAENLEAASPSQRAQIPRREEARGTVTWIDAGRNLVVLQRSSNALALHVDLQQLGLAAGESVTLSGVRMNFTPAFPAFPDKPSGATVCSSFEAPSNWGDFYLTRMRGVLHPPATGNYTFWIASDDSSELWLGENADPSSARKIAFLGMGRWTEPRQWTRVPSQQSREIFLERGKSYYIEALAQEGTGRDCLAVAWQGPGIEREVIDGRFLSQPALPGEHSSPAGILREFWTNFPAGDFAVLRKTDEFIFNFSDARVVNRSAGEFPEPLKIRPGQKVNHTQNFRWTEIEGRLVFSAKSADRFDLELAEGDSRVAVRVNANGRDINFPQNSLVRARGVCEAVGDGAELRAELFWVNDSTNVTWLDTEENWSQYPFTPLHVLSASNPRLPVGRVVRIRGRVLEEKPAGLWRVQGDDTFQGFTSNDGTKWTPLGEPVEFAMSNSVLAGFAVASHQADQPAMARFEEITGSLANLRGATIGDAGCQGDFKSTGSALTVRGCGHDIWSVGDQCFFAYNTLSGDAEIAARVSGFDSADPVAKAALMIRESLSSNSTWAAMVFMPSNRIGFQSRRETGRNSAGALFTTTADWLKLVRRNNHLLVQPAENAPLVPGEMMELLGRLGWENGHVLLTDARCRPVTEVEAPQASPPLDSGADSSIVELTDVPIAGIETEGRKAELQGRTGRFRVRGVVTFNGNFQGRRLFFIQDDSGGCSVRFRTQTLMDQLLEGQCVEITGMLNSTNGRSEFFANGFAVTGIGAMPKPLRHPFDASIKGPRAEQWIEIEGIGRSVHDDGELRVMTSDGILPVWSANGPSAALEQCVNARVRVRGVYWESPEPVLLLPSERFIEIQEPAARDPSAVPIAPVAKLRAPVQEPWLARQLRIAGVVTCVRDEFFVVQDETGGVRVQPRSATGVAVGDSVEVVGFPSDQSIGHVLENAVVRRLGQVTMPNAIELSPSDGMDASRNGLVVTLEAMVLEQRSWRGSHMLDLQAGQRAFRAVLPMKNGQLPAVANGSKVRVTGVSQIESVERAGGESAQGERPLVASLELLLRSPKDLAVLQRPPWWTWEMTAAVIAISIGIFMAAMIWIRTLRRRVEQRTGQLRVAMAKLEKEIQVSATLAERDRLAGEIHDSVEQGLSAIMMQMDAAAKVVDRSEEVGRYLAMARNMAAFSRAEVQHAVWDLQSPMLENADLVTALRRVAREISAGDQPRVSVEISGQPRQLPSTAEHHLLRIAQEAITNAVKHGNPAAIRVALDYSADSVKLSIADDGCGFNPETVSSGSGHFGLQGLRTRARKINALLSVHSGHGEGTRIEVSMPELHRQSENGNGKFETS